MPASMWENDDMAGQVGNMQVSVAVGVYPGQPAVVDPSEAELPWREDG